MLQNMLASGARRAALTRKNPQKFTKFNQSTKSMGHSAVKWPVPEEYARTTITDAWNRGRPLTADEFKTVMELEFGVSDEHPNGNPRGRSKNGKEMFHLQYFGEDAKSSSLWCQWRSAFLERCNFAIRAKTVSQKVPDDWKEQADDFVTAGRALFIAKGVEIVLAADQTFVYTHSGDNENVIAPVGAKRVGTTVDTDNKQGWTLMVTQEYSKSCCLIPYWVVGGNSCLYEDGADHERRSKLPTFLDTAKKNRNPKACRNQLDRVDGNYRTMKSSHVNFQHKHWFDKFITLRYLKDVILPYKEMYPGKHVGFILDEAPAHMSKMVMDWVHEQEDWLTVIFIPGGLTSILQVGDLLCNHCPA